MQTKKNNNKKQGFTLAELLVVVAIVAVLAAISVPVFSSQIERSKEAADVANIREAYANVVGEAVAQNKNKEALEKLGITYKVVNSCDVWTQELKLTQKANDWQDATNETAITDMGVAEISGTPDVNEPVTINYYAYPNGTSKVYVDFGNGTTATNWAKRGRQSSGSWN